MKNDELFQLIRWTSRDSPLILIWTFIGQCDLRQTFVVAVMSFITCNYIITICCTAIMNIQIFKRRRDKASESFNEFRASANHQYNFKLVLAPISLGRTFVELYCDLRCSAPNVSFLPSFHKQISIAVRRCSLNTHSPSPFILHKYYYRLNFVSPKDMCWCSNPWYLQMWPY